MSSNLENPYKPFFLIGTLAAIVGTGAWVVNAWMPGVPYPGRFHAHIMMGLFLMSFAMGFLMTVLPRMTQTFNCTRREFVFAALFLGLLATFGLSDEGGRIFFSCVLLNVGFLLFFAIRRILQKKNDVPEVFPLVMWGLASAAIGAVLAMGEYQLLGEKLFYLNFMLCLVLGVGTKLMPMLLRLPPKKAILGKFSFFLIGAMMALSSFAEEVWYAPWGSFLRAITVSFVAVFGWRLFARNATSSGLTWGIRASGFFTAMGTWALAVFPEFRLEALHIIYVMGFSLMTFMVASRVILAHGNHGIQNEMGNIFIKVPVFFLILAGITRVAAIFVPEDYTNHLAYAAMSFIIGIGFWARYFLPRIMPNNVALSK